MVNTILKYVGLFILGIIAGAVIQATLLDGGRFAGFTTLSGVNTTDGYQVDGTTIIDGSGNFDGTITSSTLTQGGGIRATSTVNSAETLLASDFDVENVIDYTLNLQDATLTLPATSTLSSFVPDAGDTRTIQIRNATTTAAMDLTIAAGTGMNLKKATSTAIIVGNTDGSNYAKLDFTRRSDTDIDVLLDIFID